MLTVSIRSSSADLLAADVHLSLRMLIFSQAVRATVWDYCSQATPISDRIYPCRGYNPC